jgi:hypothetical protein
MANIEGIGNKIFAGIINKERMVYSENIRKRAVLIKTELVIPKPYIAHITSLESDHFL